MFAGHSVSFPCRPPARIKPKGPLVIDTQATNTFSPLTTEVERKHFFF